MAATLLVRGGNFLALVLPLHLHADVLGAVVTVHFHQLGDCHKAEKKGHGGSLERKGMRGCLGFC